MSPAAIIRAAHRQTNLWIAIGARQRRQARPYVRIKMRGTRHAVTKPATPNLIACNSNEAGR